MENSQQQTCSFCGAEKVLNPKTGKWFCKEKCWLNKSQPQESVQAGINNRARDEGQNNKKFDSAELVTAKHVAGEYANMMLNQRHIRPDQWDKTFYAKAREIYNFEIN